MNQKTQEQKKMNQQKLENQLNRGIVFYGSIEEILGESDHLEFNEDENRYYLDMNAHRIAIDSNQTLYFYKSPVNREYVIVMYTTQPKEVIILFHDHELDEMIDLENNVLDRVQTMPLDELPAITYYIDGHDSTRKQKSRRGVV